jgi:hypothetical protein
MRSKKKRLVWATLLVLAGCSGSKPPPALQPGARLAGTEGLMNFRQIRSAWAAATGLDPFDHRIERAFAELQDRLPANNALNQIGQPVVTASVALGAAFCRILVDREAKQDPKERRFYGALSLEKAPEEASLRDAAERLSSALWRRLPRTEETAELVNLGKETYSLGIRKPDATPAIAGREAWLSMCTAAGAALDALTL